MTKPAETTRPTRVHAITHIHTNASDAATSELNDRIDAILHAVDGPNTKMTWAECFTPISDFLKVLERGRGDRFPVHMIFVTDHMRRQSHRYPDGHLAAAAEDHRLILGSELATRTRDVDGKYRLGPEILAYGGPQMVDGPHGPYYGLSQELIDELYATCLDDDGDQLCTRRAGALLSQRGIVHGLSHPFDGHDLSLEGTLSIITEFAYIETLNGGYPDESARMLQALIDLNNGLLAGKRLPEGVLSKVGQRIIDQIQSRGRWMFPLGGSDAHAGGYDRVVTAVAPPSGLTPEQVTPGELLGRMLTLADRRPCRRPVGCQQPSNPFEPRGATIAARAMVADVISIVLKNIRLNLRNCKKPLSWARLLPMTYPITRDEFSKRSRIQRKRMRALHEDFNPVSLLGQLEPTTEQRLPCALPEFIEAPQPASSPLVPAMPWPAMGGGRLEELGLSAETPARLHARAQVSCEVKR